MSAAPVVDLFPLSIPVGKAVPIPVTTQALHVSLIRHLQDVARGVPRLRRARLLRQFAREWRDFVDQGGVDGHRAGLPPRDYPLLRTLQDQVQGGAGLRDWSSLAG